jgi:hypothetical protein
MFQKIIEPVKYVGVDNLRSKDELQKKFFPDNKGAIEFLENPSFRGEYGFRMLKTDDNHYILEIKEVANWQEIKNKLDIKYPIKLINESLSQEEREKLYQINGENLRKINQSKNDVISEYIIKTTNIEIRESFANKLYDTFVYLIMNYKNKGPDFITQPDGSQMIISRVVYDGSQLTFRCIVDNEIWSLFIGKSFDEIDKLTEICNEIIADSIKNGKINEEKYIKILNELIE